MVFMAQDWLYPSRQRGPLYMLVRVGSRLQMPWKTPTKLVLGHTKACCPPEMRPEQKQTHNTSKHAADSRDTERKDAGGNAHASLSFAAPKSPNGEKTLLVLYKRG